jgi:hypothetical protein
VIEEDFNAVLNWKLESDVRRTPVWKSSVSTTIYSSSSHISRVVISIVSNTEAQVVCTYWLCVVLVHQAKHDSASC